MPLPRCATARFLWPAQIRLSCGPAFATGAYEREHRGSWAVRFVSAVAGMRTPYWMSLLADSIAEAR